MFVLFFFFFFCLFFFFFFFLPITIGEEVKRGPMAYMPSWNWGINLKLLLSYLILSYLVSQLKTSFSPSTACTHNRNGQIAPTKVQPSDTNRQATCCLIRTEWYRNWLNYARDPWFTTQLPQVCCTAAIRALFLGTQDRAKIVCHLMAIVRPPYGGLAVWLRLCSIAVSGKKV